MPEDRFRTLAGPSHREIPRIKGSRFIGDAFPTAAVEDAEKRVAEIRAREPNATHHCWAYRIGLDDDTYRYDDDGEPSGTAGRPILRQIDGRNLRNVIVIVTRYYGGTNLGTGGLVHAYGAAAKAVLNAGSTVDRVLREPVELTFSYDDTSAVMQVLHRFDADVEASSYTDVTELLVRVRRSQVEAFVEAITNALRGKGEVTRPSTT